jgi:phosphate transport system permease protein
MSTLTPPVRRTIVVRPTRSERAFVLGARAAAVGTLVVMGLIGTFLAVGAVPAFRSQGWGFLTQHEWLPETGHFGIAALLWGTILIAVFALIVAVPLALGAALFISEYAPRSLRRPLVTLVDLMAAVPAVIYAIWALFFLQAQLLTVAQWLSVHLGGLLPFLSVKVPDSPSSYTSSAFIAGIAVGVVVLPTMTSVMREVFAQAPAGEREGAIALGATRWGMIRTVVLPFGRAGIVGGIMLGLGRALGETIVVYALISPMFDFTTHPLESGTNAIAAHIASRYSESNGVALAGLLGAGLVLFAFTLVINTLAGIVVSRSRSGAATEI